MRYLGQQILELWYSYGVDIELLFFLFAGIGLTLAAIVHRRRNISGVWLLLAFLCFGCFAYIWKYYATV